MTFTVNEFKAGKYRGSWPAVATLGEAMAIIASMKITLANGSVFNVENSAGTVVEVVKA